jgi:ABC-2 type transport system permease protein
LRDPVYLGLAFVVPMVLMILFGAGLSMDVKHLPILFIDHDGTPWSRDFMDGFVHSEYFDFQGVAFEAAAAERRMREGSARVIVDIPPGFGRDLSRGRTVAIGMQVDGSFPTRAEVIISYTESLVALFNERQLRKYRERNPQARLPATPVGMDISVWYNPALESVNFVVPGVMVLIMMLYPALLGAMLVVREKETGTIFNLYCAPVGRLEILLGKALPYICVAYLDYLLIFSAGIWVFEARFIGSFAFLSLAALIYAVCTIGLGLLISVLTRTQLAALLITFLATLTPSFNFSGFITPVASMDPVGQFIAHLLPATYFMAIVRGIFLKGLGPGFYWEELGALLLFVLAFYGLAWAALRKRIG